MSKHIAVVLSGCGVYDGAEIYESVITLIRLDQSNAKVRCFAPNIPQLHVINHLTGEVAEGESRNVLVEAARITRGAVEDLAQANADDFDALIVPGGFGAAKNLCDFAINGSQLTVNKDFLALAQAMHRQGKPIGLVCIAPAMSAAIFGQGVQCTIGNDADTASTIEAMGACHQECAPGDICIDDNNNLITTPAYMLAERIAEAAAGINKLVDTVLSRA